MSLLIVIMLICLMFIIYNKPSINVLNEVVMNKTLLLALVSSAALTLVGCQKNDDQATATDQGEASSVQVSQGVVHTKLSDDEPTVDQQEQPMAQEQTIEDVRAKLDSVGPQNTNPESTAQSVDELNDDLIMQMDTVGTKTE